MTFPTLHDPVVRIGADRRAQFDECDIRWQPVGSVHSIGVRIGKEPGPRCQSQVQAIANYGLVSDRHASLQSPRQLLVAGTAAYQRLALPPATLRENLLMDFPTEQLRSGDLLCVGPEVVLWMTFQCEPCSLLERKSPGILRSIGEERGMLARVLRGGTMKVGDTIAWAQSSIPGFSDDWQKRVAAVVRAIPPGHYIVYRQLAELAGVATAYCRAFPRVLSRLPRDVSTRVRDSTYTGPWRQWKGTELFDVSAHVARAASRPSAL